MEFVNRYRDHQLSSDDDSEDSDKECNVWKRATSAKRTTEDEILPSPQTEQLNEKSTNNKRKVNSIWTDVLQDQLISEDLGGCLLKNKPAQYGSRGTESYDYTLKYQDTRLLNELECPMEEEHCDKERKSYPQAKPKVKKFVKLNSAEQGAARKILRVLNEKKVYLIERIVKFIGIEKAMTLLSMTEQIEDTGGMMIKNNARRRTPGGVYLQLLKADKDVTKEVLDKIFEGEMTCMELKQMYAEKKKRRKQFKGKKNESERIMELGKPEPFNIVMNAEETNSISSFTNSTSEDNPVSASNPEISLDNDCELEEGEIED